MANVVPIMTQMLQALQALKVQGIPPMYGAYYKATISSVHETSLVRELEFSGMLRPTIDPTGPSVAEYIEPNERLVAIIGSELLVVVDRSDQRAEIDLWRELEHEVRLGREHRVDVVLAKLDVMRAQSVIPREPK
jgi:hypothetical protein